MQSILFSGVCDEDECKTVQHMDAKALALPVALSIQITEPTQVQTNSLPGNVMEVAVKLHDTPLEELAAVAHPESIFTNRPPSKHQTFFPEIMVLNIISNLF